MSTLGITLWIWKDQRCLSTVQRYPCLGLIYTIEFSLRLASLLTISVLLLAQALIWSDTTLFPTWKLAKYLFQSSCEMVRWLIGCWQLKTLRILYQRSSSTILIEPTTKHTPFSTYICLTPSSSTCNDCRICLVWAFMIYSQPLEWPVRMSWWLFLPDETMRIAVGARLSGMVQLVSYWQTVAPMSMQSRRASMLRFIVVKISTNFIIFTKPTHPSFYYLSLFATNQSNKQPFPCGLQQDILSMRLNEYNASTSVYLEQIGNHIELGEGYSQLRKHLFRELHQMNNGEVVSDDKLSDSIVAYLAGALNKTVNFHRSAQTFRILQIIEDLLTYAEEVMTPAMHTELFVSALIHTANPKIITFDSKMDADCRSHALGIFLSWFDRYGRDQECSYELFIKAYRQLRDKKLLFPNQITIKPSDFFKKELENEKNAPKPAETNEGKTNRIVLQDIQAFTIKTQSLFKENFKSIATTEYVRLIKHKSKVLFEFTSKPNDFKDKEKNLVKDLYKRLRVVLKELDKFKETSLQTKKSEVAQKQYVEAKMTPKKAPPVQMSPLGEKTVSSPEKKGIPSQKVIVPPIASQNIDLLDMAPPPKTMSTPQKKTQSKKASTPKIEQPVNVDLLNDGPKLNAPTEQQQEFVEAIVVTAPETENGFKKKEQQALFQVFSTPKKQVHDEEGGLLAKQASNNSQDLSPGFQNEKMAKNPYSYIPEHLNLTPTSSVQDQEERVKDKPSFSFFGLFNKAPSGQPQGLQEQAKHYDSVHKKGKAVSEQTPQKVPPIINQPPLTNIQVKDIVNSPNYKPVAAVNYEIYAQFIPVSPQKDEESKFELTPKKSGDKQLKQADFDTPKSGKMIRQEQ